jgi:hypothetical protein
VLLALAGRAASAVPVPVTARAHLRGTLDTWLSSPLATPKTATTGHRGGCFGALQITSGRTTRRPSRGRFAATGTVGRPACGQKGANSCGSSR